MPPSSEVHFKRAACIFVTMFVTEHLKSNVLGITLFSLRTLKDYWADIFFKEK